MRGLRRPTDAGVWFFAAYALYLLIQYPVSKSYPGAWVFYGLLLPAAAVYAVRQRARLAEMLALPAVQAFLLLFVYVVFHALLFAPGYEGVSKTLLNTVDTAVFFLCSVAFFAHADRPFLHRCFLLLTVLVSLCAIVSIYLHFTHPDITGRMSPIGRSRNATLGGYSYGLAGIVAIYMREQSVSAMRRGGYLLVTLLIGALIVLTRTRMAIIDYTLTALLLHCAYVRSLRPAAFAMLIAIVVVPLALFTIPVLPHDVDLYANNLLARKDAHRVELWSQALHDIAQHPLLGNGMRAMLTIRLYGHERLISPHSLYLSTAFYLGIPGLLLFLYPLYQTARHGLRLFLSRDQLGILAAALLLMGLTAALTDFGPLVKTPGPLWIIFWLPVAFVLGMAIQSKNHFRASSPS